MNKKLVSIILTIALCLGLLPTGVYAEENTNNGEVIQQTEQTPNEEDTQIPNNGDDVQSPNEEDTQSPNENEEEQITNNNTAQLPNDDEQKITDDNTAQLPNNEEQQAPNENDTQSPSDDEEKAPNENDVQSPSDDEEKVPNENDVQSPSDDEEKVPNENDVQSPSDDKEKAPNENDVQSPSDDEEKAPNDSDILPPSDSSNNITPPSGITAVTNKIMAKAATPAPQADSVASVEIDGVIIECVTIEAAFAAAAGGTATITLLKDITVANGNTIVVDEDTDITFVGGEHSLTFTENFISPSAIKVNGTFTLQSCTIKNEKKNQDTIYVEGKNSKITINGGSLLYNGNSDFNYGSLLICECADVKINGGTIDRLYTLYTTITPNVVLSGGTFNYGIGISGADDTYYFDLLAKGYQYFQADGKTAFTDFGDKNTDEKIIVAEECQHEFNTDGVCTICGLTAIVTVTADGTTTAYNDIAKAFEAANGKTATVHILKGDNPNDVPEGVDELDPDTYDLFPKIEITGGNITLTTEEKTILFRNIVITGGTFTRENGVVVKITVNGGKAILNGESAETETRPIPTAYILEVNSGSAEINGGMIMSTLAKGGTINITDGVFVGMSEDLLPIAVSGDAVVTVDGIARIWAIIVEGGTVEYKNDFSSIEEDFYCTFLMTDGTDGTVNISGGQADIPNIQGGTVNISGGQAGIPNIQGGTVNISGGMANISDMVGGTLNITDGEISYLGAYDGEVTISGGKFDTVYFYSNFSNVEISGGTFYHIATYASDAVTIKDFLKKGYAYYINDSIVENANELGFIEGADENNPVVVKECTHMYDESDIHDSGDGTHGGTCTICGYSKSGIPHVDEDDDGICDDCGIEFVTSVTVGSDTKYFAEFEQAWEAAKKAEKATVTALKIVDFDSITVEDGNDITLNVEEIENNVIGFDIDEIIVNGGVLTLSNYVQTRELEVNGGTVSVLGNTTILENLVVNDGTVTVLGDTISVDVVVNGGAISISDNARIYELQVNDGDVSISGGYFATISTVNDALERKACDLLANGYAYRKFFTDAETLKGLEWLTPEEYHNNVLEPSSDKGYMVEEVPVQIVNQSQDTEVIYGAEMPALTVTTQPTDGVTYQWHSVDEQGNSTPIENATQNSYTPEDLEIGSYQYYCDVTFTDSEGYEYTISSEVITVTVVEKKADKILPKLTLTASPAQLNEGGTVTLTLTGLPDGETATVVCDDSSIEVVSGENNTFTVTLPDTQKTYTFTANYAGNDVFYAANASCTVVVSKNNNDTVVLPDPPQGNDGETLQIVMENGITTVPEGLKDIDTLNTPQKLETAMKASITEINADIKKENTAVYNVTLMVSTDGGITWVPATEDNFPESGELTITLPYPEGTDSNYQFVVVHMFTTNAFGKAAGTTESPEVENTENGIRFTVTGLSPISVGWTAPEKPDKPNTNTTSKRSGGGGRTGSLKMYDITVENSVGGKVTPSRTTAPSGSSVTLNIQANSGYTLENIVVTDELSKTVAIDDKNTFYMPSSNVSVKATFTETADNTENVETNDEKDCPSSTFVDLQQNAWYHQAVDFVLENGLMNGYNSTEFAPNNNISRAQLAQILYNKEGRPAINSNNVFTDVPENEWYADAVNWAASKGIVNGYGNGIFAPNDNITREQLAVMLWQYAQKPNYNNKELSFHDVQQISDYASDALYWAVENGILNGYEDSTLRPNGLATRAQAAQMLKTFID